jgi:arylsulfatase A-like enzyme
MNPMTVIVLLADGVRADTLTRAIDAGALPALARLRREGGLHTVTSAFPSVTGPAYAPFLMGRFPASIGLPGLRWYDRSREVCTYPDYSRSYVGYQMGKVNTDIDPTAPTIFELVPGSVAALSVITRGLARENQLAALTARSALRAAATHFRGDLAGWLRVDRDVSARLIERVRNSRARFVFAAFTGVDKMSHAGGHDSQQVLDALRIVDDTADAIITDLERRGGWRDTHLWVTSDHGHSRVTAHEDLARVIETHGRRVLAHPWVLTVRPEVAVMVSGNAMAHLYVDLARRGRPYWKEMSERGRELAALLAPRESVDLMLIPLDSFRCEVWSRVRGRAIVSRQQHSRAYSYRMTGGDPLGIGRDLVNLSAADAHEATLCSDYPDSVVQIAHIAGSRRSGDIILSAARDWDYRARFEPIPHVSAHGALHHEHMAVPLLINGPVARRPRRTTDVLPSALAALGIGIPAGLDGESFL